MSLLLSPMLWRAIAAAAILAGLAWGYHLWADHQREIGRQEIRPQVAALQAAWDADKLVRAEETRLLLMANAKREGALQADADKERKALREKNRTLGRELAASIERLQDRPPRPEPADRADGVPEVAGDGGTGPGHAGSTGQGLYRQDGEFLVGEAADAKRLQLALRSCRAARARDQAAVKGAADGAK